MRWCGTRSEVRGGCLFIYSVMEGESWFELMSKLDAIERKKEHTMYGFEIIRRNSVLNHWHFIIWLV